GDTCSLTCRRFGLWIRRRRRHVAFAFAAIDPESGNRDDLPVGVGQNGFVAAQRIGDERDLSGAGEEVPLDEQVHLRELDAEAGMAVIPADDALAAVVLVDLLVDLGPGVLGEGDVSGPFTRRVAADDGVY